MSERPTLYLNENVPIKLVDLLANLGIKAIHTLTAGNKGVTDETQLRYAAERRYVLVTHNRKDFRHLHRAWVEERKNHFGILVMSHGEPAYLAKRIQRFFETRYQVVDFPFCEVPPA